MILPCFEFLKFFFEYLLSNVAPLTGLFETISHQLRIVFIFETVQTCLRHGATLDTDELKRNSGLVASDLETLW